MKKIRIGNDIHVNWTILDVDGQPYIVEGKDIRVFMDVQSSSNMRTFVQSNPSIEVTEFTATDNVISFTYWGREQEVLGNYILRFTENAGEVGMVTFDLKDAFSIVAHSWLEGQGDTTTIETEVVNLTSVIDHSIMAELARKADKVEGATAGNVAILTEDGNLADSGVRPAGIHPYLSLERLRAYLYRVTFDTLPEDNGGDNPIVGGCSSYVQNGKLYTNLDWDYSNTASFLVVTKDFGGQSFVGGLDDGMLDDALIAQLPYRVHRGVNNHGIKVATHVLFNDWQWTGAGSRNTNITRLPFEVLSRVKSMATIASDLSGVLGNLYCPEGLASMGYLMQVLVTDGTTTYAILPPTSEGQGFILQDMTSNPKMTNFRWVDRAQVERTDSDIQERPTGIERFNLMPCPLEDLRFTKCYERADRLSEFIGVHDTTKDASDAQLEAIYLEARALYLDRQRDGRTWQTMESAVYGDKMESLWIQENWNDDIVAQGGGGGTGVDYFEIINGVLNIKFES